MPSGTALVRVLPLLGAALLAACATLTPPSKATTDAALAAPTYSARLGVSLNGPRGRARVTVLAAFARPDALRVEVPGPGGARLLVVTRAGRLVAVFPGERAVFEGRAEAADLEAVLGVALAPAEIMDVLVGATAGRLAEARVEWDAKLPRRVRGRLADGTSLDIKVHEAEAPAPLPAAAFTEPPHAGYRSIDADEARNMWVRR